MIMTVAELRQFVTTDKTEQALEARLRALELLVRAYTNNNFQVRAFRAVAVASSDKTLSFDGSVFFKAGDTLQITESAFQPNTLVTVSSVSDNKVTVNETLYDEERVLVTKVVYPADVKFGVANMLKWQLDNEDRLGIQSETLSRHSVTYFSLDAANSIAGFPSSIVGFLKPYIKARF